MKIKEYKIKDYLRFGNRGVIISNMIIMSIIKS